MQYVQHDLGECTFVLEVYHHPIVDIRWGIEGRYLPRPPNGALLRAIWSLLDGIWGLLKGSWGVPVGSFKDPILSTPGWL